MTAPTPSVALWPLQRRTAHAGLRGGLDRAILARRARLRRDAARVARLRRRALDGFVCALLLAGGVMAFAAIAPPGGRGTAIATTVAAAFALVVLVREARARPMGPRFAWLVPAAAISLGGIIGFALGDVQWPV